MALSNQAIKEFQELYRNKYGIILDKKKARTIATAFYNMMRVVYQPIPTEVEKDLAGKKS